MCGRGAEIFGQEGRSRDHLNARLSHLTFGANGRTRPHTVTKWVCYIWSLYTLAPHDDDVEDDDDDGAMGGMGTIQRFNSVSKFNNHIEYMFLISTHTRRNDVHETESNGNWLRLRGSFGFNGEWGRIQTILLMERWLMGIGIVKMNGFGGGIGIGYRSPKTWELLSAIMFCYWNINVHYYRTHTHSHTHYAYGW